MNIVMWIVAGGLLGWIGYSFLGFNEGRSMVAAAIIGAVGGLVGGNVIAPMFSAAAVPADFSASAMFFALAAATAFLYAGNFVHDRWGV